MADAWSNYESRERSWPRGRSRWSRGGGEFDVHARFTRALDEARRRDGRPPLDEENRRKRRIGAMFGMALGAGLVAAGAGFFARRRQPASFGARLRSAFPWGSKARAKVLPFRAASRVREFVKRAA